MKLRWLALFFAAFLLVSPIASADEGSSSWLAGVIEQIVSLLVGNATDSTNPQGGPEGGVIYPPSGEPQSITSGDPSELGMVYPPGG